MNNMAQERAQTALWLSILLRGTKDERRLARQLGGLLRLVQVKR